jgi:erythromycin esterase-like protein
VIFRRSRFGAIVDTQLDVFVRDHRDLLDEVDERLAAYNRADRSEAEELYGDYVDAVDAAADALAEMRDHYARTVDDPDGYERAFNRAAARRLPQSARELDSR